MEQALSVSGKHGVGLPLGILVRHFAFSGSGSASVSSALRRVLCEAFPPFPLSLGASPSLPTLFVVERCAKRLLFDPCF